MKWENLKTEQCPKCGAFLKKATMYVCEFCGFRISFGKAISIVGTPTDLEAEASALLKKTAKKRRLPGAVEFPGKRPEVLSPA